MNTPPAPVSLREITADTVRAVTALQVADDQQRFVAPNAVSLAQALFSPQAWYRAICLADQPVGFVMLYDESLAPTAAGRPRVGVWRFMVDARHQRQGIGRAALQLVIAHCRDKAVFDELELSYVPGPGSPEPFYRGLGFQPTGRRDGDELVLAYPFPPAQATAPAAAPTPDADSAGAPLIAGRCLCGAAGWQYRGTPRQATACNCTACRRYGVLWAYGHEGEDVVFDGATRAYVRGDALGFHFCPGCGCMVGWRGLAPDKQGRLQVAVNLRLAEPAAVAAVPMRHFDGLDRWQDLPADGRCVRDMWF